MTRLAIVDPERCRPDKCKQECKKRCPVNAQDKQCITVTPRDKIAVISEELCIGCGICSRVCPYQAIQIVNVPSELEKETTHRYGENGFKLHRLPTPRPGQVLGLVGTNGIGKSTALTILKGNLQPNLGRFEDPPEWDAIIRFFRGGDLQTYFNKLAVGDLNVVMKPQYVDFLSQRLSGTPRNYMKSLDTRGICDEVCKTLELTEIMDRDIEVLSGGELQRFALASTLIQKADVYLFDEPSSYLDVKQRMTVARMIRSITSLGAYVVVVEHDLSILDYLSDFICVLYGVPGAYGVVTMPYGVREGINIFLDGFIPTENMRFREYELNFKIGIEEVEPGTVTTHQYPSFEVTKPGFTLTIEEGSYRDSEITVLLGQNGIGKSTFIRSLFDRMKDIEGVSYKPQIINPKFKGTVRQLLQERIPAAFGHSQFISDVLRPMSIERILDQKLKLLSGGELQRVAIVYCLGTPANVYLIDEPSAYLDSEQRVIVSRIIKRFILNSRKTAFIVEHDFIMSTYLADKVVVFDGEPGVKGTARSPQPLVSGMNKFLEQLGVTFRRDPGNFRPRINKLESIKDREQKETGNFFYT